MPAQCQEEVAAEEEEEEERTRLDLLTGGERQTDTDRQRGKREERSMRADCRGEYGAIRCVYAQSERRRYMIW